MITFHQRKNIHETIERRAYTSTPVCVTGSIIGLWTIGKQNKINIIIYRFEKNKLKTPRKKLIQIYLKKTEYKYNRSLRNTM